MKKARISLFAKGGIVGPAPDEESTSSSDDEADVSGRRTPEGLYDSPRPGATVTELRVTKYNSLKFKMRCTYLFVSSDIVAISRDQLHREIFSIFCSILGMIVNKLN